MDHRYKKFLILVDAGSYSAAAKRLRISQPAMTFSVASLEKALGIKLLARKKPSIELTAEGQIVYQSAQKIESEITNMRAKLVGSHASQLSHVGLIDSIAHLVYSSSKGSIIFNDIEVMVDNSKRIINDILTNQIDFGVITGQARPIVGAVKTNRLADEPFAFVKKPSMVGDCAIEIIDDWLAFNRASTSYRHFARQFKKQSLKVTPIFFSTSMELLKEMAIAGNGTALLPLHFVEQDVKRARLKVLDTVALYRPIWVVTRRGSNYSSVKPLSDYVDGLLQS